MFPPAMQPTDLLPSTFSAPLINFRSPGPSAPSGLLVVALLASVLSPAISFHSSPNPFPTSTFLAAHRAACQHPKQCTSPRPSERAPASMLQSGFAGVSSSRRGRADRVLLRAVEEEQAGGVAAPGLMERQDEEQEGAAGESRYWTWREVFPRAQESFVQRLPQTEKNPPYEGRI